MFFALPWILAVLLAAFHAWLRRSRLNRVGILETFLRYQFALGLAPAGLFAFLGHAFRPEKVALGIGWAPHPAFQFELAAFELGFGLAALGALWTRNRGYWLGITLAPSVFMLLAGFQHIQQALLKGNFAAYNLLAVLPDLLLPGTLLGLLAALHSADRVNA